MNMEKRKIPVIHFSSENNRWEPLNKKSEPCIIAAIYKNQTEADESRMLKEAAASGELYALRNERRRAVIAERAMESQRNKKKMTRDFRVLLLIAIILLAMFLYLQS